MKPLSRALGLSLLAVGLVVGCEGKKEAPAPAPAGMDPGTQAKDPKGKAPNAGGASAMPTLPGSGSKKP